MDKTFICLASLERLRYTGAVGELGSGIQAQRGVNPKAVAGGVSVHIA